MDSVAYIVRSYPRLSQTFVLNEIRSLERLGLNIRIFAITDPREPIQQSDVAEIKAPVHYLDAMGQHGSATISTHLGLALRYPGRYLSTLLHAVGSWQADTGYRVASRYQCFHYAVHLASILTREILLRQGILKRGGWLFFLVTCVCMAVSAFYEFIEWWTALAAGGAAEAFLGTQGDVWDTQWDMFTAMCGAIVAQLLLSRWHDRQIAARPAAETVREGNP